MQQKYTTKEMTMMIVSFYQIEPSFHCKKNRNKTYISVLITLLTVLVVVLFYKVLDVMVKIVADQIVEDEYVEIIE